MILYKCARRDSDCVRVCECVEPVKARLASGKWHCLNGPTKDPHSVENHRLHSTLKPHTPQLLVEYKWQGRSS